MQYIKAPFNFVAVSNEVYFPGWANQISHDIPFSDGLSGQITVELKAETPIFIRDSKDPTRFCHVIDENGHKKFFIPGTSLKGTIRSVLEILSFAKMDKINDHKYAIRDLHNPGVYNLMKDSANIHCGWFRLIKDENGVESGTIRDCDTPWRISHKQLDDELRTGFVSIFIQGGTADFGNPLHKTAKYKYNNVVRGIGLIHQFAETTTSYGRQLCDFNSSGKQGTLVFTGQAGARKTTGHASGKFYEFVFIEQTNPASITVNSKIWEEFKFHYFDNDPKNISTDWKWRKGQLKKDIEIPVFFRINPSDPSKVKDLGLAYLYKMPYNYSVKERLPQEHRLPFFKPDLAECIFGNTNEIDALKGRVQFSTAWADMNTVNEGDSINTILGTPRASYYPIYIKQKGNKGSVVRVGNRPDYKTYMNPDAELAGRKRYPLRETEEQNLTPGTENMNVSFSPLNRGAIFAANINYFNLRPAELGALLSALTFHNNANECYHGLGMAKPYGFGRVSLTILEGAEKDIIPEYLNEFESEMNAYMQVDNPKFKWCQSDPIKEFIALSKLQRVEGDRLTYMRLSEFAKAKNSDNGFYLEDYCSITNDNSVITPYAKSEKVDEKKGRAKQARVQLKKEMDSFADREKSRKKEIEEKEQLKKAEKRIKEMEAAQKARSEVLAKENKAAQKRLEEERLKQEAIRKEREKRQQEEADRIKKRGEQLKKTGLAPLIQDISKFTNARSRIKQYMKQISVTRLDGRDTDSLKQKARDWYLSTPDKIKEKRWKPTDGPDWKKIASWIGSELARRWYDDLIREKK